MLRHVTGEIVFNNFVCLLEVLYQVKPSFRRIY